MNICFECSEYPPGPHGGIGSLVQLLARRMAEAGHGVRVVGIYPESYPAPDYQEDGSVKVWRLRLPAARLGWIAARHRLSRLVLSWSRSGAIDLVEVPDYGAPAAGWPKLQVPVIARLSGSTSFFRREMGKKARWTTYLLERNSLRRADFVCSESRYLAMRTREIFRLRSEPDAIIYNPVEVPDHAGGGSRVPHQVMFAGTLTRKKGVVSLVKSWPLVLRGCPDAELHIWGKDGQTESGGSMKEYLGSLIPAETSRSVLFRGHVALDQLLAAFETCGLAVLPSYSEGFALTPLHAMAAGCPTIYTSRGSGPELIEHERTGLLIDPDSPEEIAAAILRVLRDPVLAGTLGANGRHEVLTRFSWGSLFPQNEHFYKRCLELFHNDGQVETAKP